MKKKACQKIFPLTYIKRCLLDAKVPMYVHDSGCKAAEVLVILGLMGKHKQFKKFHTFPEIEAMDNYHLAHVFFISNRKSPV